MAINQGSFHGAYYNLTIAADQYHLKRMRLNAPLTCPSDGIVDVEKSDSIEVTTPTAKTCWCDLCSTISTI